MSRASVISRGFVAFDAETTGLDPASDEIVELGAVRCDAKGVVFEERQWWFAVEEMPAAAYRVHGLSQADTVRLSAGRSFAAQAPQVHEWFDAGLPWAGHNLEFDVAFLRTAFERAGRELPEVACVDTLALSRALNPMADRHTLDAVARRFGLGRRGALHGALEDAALVASVLPHLLRRMDRPTGLSERARRLAGVGSKAGFSLPDRAALNSAGLAPFGSGASVGEAARPPSFGVDAHLGG